MSTEVAANEHEHPTKISHPQPPTRVHSLESFSMDEIPPHAYLLQDLEERNTCIECHLCGTCSIYSITRRTRKQLRLEINKEMVRGDRIEDALQLRVS